MAEDVGRVAASAAKVADSQWSQKIYGNHHIMNFYTKLMSQLSFLSFENESLRNNLVTTLHASKFSNATSQSPLQTIKDC